MKFTELSVKDFEDFALKHDQISFHQSKEWALLKKVNGWEAYYVGALDGKKIVAASLLLAKSTPIKKKMFYAPRGFLIDYENKEILKFFTIEVKKFVRKKGGFFIKIDPYVSYRQRDVNGNIVDGGYCHDDIVSNLKELGYHHYGFKNGYQQLQPRFIFWLPLKNKTEEEIWDKFSKDTKRHINKTKKELLVLEEVTKDNIDDFCGIMEHTSKRRGFIDRPKSYYLRMLDVFGKHIKILSAVLYTDKALSYWKEQLSILEKDKVDKEKIVSESGSKKSKDALKQVEKEITEIKQNISDLESIKEKYGSRIVLASSMFLMYGKEVLYLFSGSYKEFMKYNAQYLIQWEMIQYAIKNKYERYNFYGIEGKFDDENGVYGFKKGFDGEVVEFIGEFDLVVNKGYYYLYKMAFSMYHKFKHLKFSLSRKEH